MRVIVCLGTLCLTACGMNPSGPPRHVHVVAGNSTDSTVVRNIADSLWTYHGVRPDTIELASKGWLRIVLPPRALGASVTWVNGKCNSETTPFGAFGELARRANRIGGAALHADSIWVQAEAFADTARHLLSITSCGVGVTSAYFRRPDAQVFGM